MQARPRPHVQRGAGTALPPAPQRLQDAVGHRAIQAVSVLLVVQRGGVALQVCSSKVVLQQHQQRRLELRNSVVVCVWGGGRRGGEPTCEAALPQGAAAPREPVPARPPSPPPRSPAWEARPSGAAVGHAAAACHGAAARRPLAATHRGRARSACNLGAWRFVRHAAEPVHAPPRNTSSSSAVRASVVHTPNPAGGCRGRRARRVVATRCSAAASRAIASPPPPPPHLA